LYVWNYAIVVNKWIFDNFTLNPELIIHTVQVDKSNRILLPKNFLTTYGIDPEDYVYVIGKWNHIELYFQKEKFEETKNRAIQAATQFQVNLVLNKEL
jgi:DNA-binding transcriptional regulator/RsmH inhibitor MraZ